MYYILYPKWIGFGLAESSSRDQKYFNYLKVALKKYYLGEKYYLGVDFFFFES